MSQKTPERLSEENEPTKQKERDNVSKKTLLLQKNLQRVEAQGKRGKIKSVTTQITKELLDYIKQNFEGYSLLVLSYIILGALISIRKLFMTAFLDTDEFLSEKLGLIKPKASENKSRGKGRNNQKDPLANKEITAETLRTLFNKSLMSEFEKFKSSKIHLSQDLFDKIQNTLYKMKIPSMIGGVSEQDVIKYEEEKILNPLFKRIFTEPNPNPAILQLIKDSQYDTKNFANMLGINVENLVNKEGILDNGGYFPNSAENNIIDGGVDVVPGNEGDYPGAEKESENIKLELIKKNIIEENLMDRNNLVWKKDKKYFEFDIPTYLEMTKEENEDMTVNDIKNVFFKNLERINADANFIKYKQSLQNNKYNIKIGEIYDSDEKVQKELKTKSLFGYFFFGNGNDYVNFIKNEILSSGKSSDLKRIDIGEILSSQKLELNNEADKAWNEFKGKTFNPMNNIEYMLDDSSPYEFSSQMKFKESYSKYLSEKKENEERCKSEIMKEIIKLVGQTKFYQNIKVDNFVDKINENTVLIHEYNDKEKKSLVFYNLLISCQSCGFNLQQNNPFMEFFFVKNN